jgi:hypothetical protein
MDSHIMFLYIGLLVWGYKLQLTDIGTPGYSRNGSVWELQPHTIAYRFGIFET